MNPPAPSDAPWLLPREFRVDRIVSGGQTGVDRAALDVALELGIPHGGWCPRGRRAEDGSIPDRYLLREHASELYSERTRQNVLDSDGTLVLFGNRLEGGTLLTARFARQQEKPIHCVRLAGRISFIACIEWLVEYEIRILNIAGPRASKEPKSYEKARRFLLQLLG